MTSNPLSLLVGGRHHPAVNPQIRSHDEVCERNPQWLFTTTPPL